MYCMALQAFGSELMANAAMRCDHKQAEEKCAFVSISHEFGERKSVSTVVIIALRKYHAKPQNGIVIYRFPDSLSYYVVPTSYRNSK
ncbi:hypothetical protein CFC21_034923 [Triticum aestivum]|uniref:Uncharacterized protein n=4 Tax=Triticum TaxID=4564 RepID=A0A9R0RGC6_TRITD|nr:hypothetical protein TRIUR3_07959 [Triticum urartu]KAF7022088.1 hypothetical protein CFC21_034923 [Triticum aestivum]VAH59601.1 unnamed protein product [Triticum turgidum subsp. durum]